MKAALWLAGISLLGAPVALPGQSLSDAAAAYRQNQVGRSEAILARLLEDPKTSAAERARALRARARIAFHVDGDLAAALRYLAAAEAAGVDLCETAVAKARLLREGKQSRQLLGDAETLSKRCPDPAQAGTVRLAAAGAALDLAAEQAWSAGALQQSGFLLTRLPEEERTSLGGSALRLQAALLRHQPAEAFQAWRDYFWLGSGDAPQGVAVGPGGAAALFQRGAAAEAAVEDRLQLLDLLVRAGFAEAAERFAAQSDLPRQAAGRPVWRRAQAYFKVRRELEAAVLAANRRLARGGAGGDLQAVYREGLQRLAEASGQPGGPDAIRDAYGLYGTAGATGGFASIHLGHVVRYERRTVEQYGHHAEVSFVTLDNMVSNGFQSWLWDGDAETGGWTAAGPVIVQVRTGYTESPLESWRIASGGSERTRILARQQERAAADLAAAAGGQKRALGGLADRLRVQVADQVLAKVRRENIAPADLKRAFLDEYWRASFQHSMLAHEGRHAIDRDLVKGLAATDDTNLEYRAKLSELALADYPRLALYNMVVADVGEEEGHPAANLRIITNLSAWAAAHGAEIANFDPRQPPAVQLDRLSDDQLRKAARSLDPLAKSTSKE